MTFEPGESPKDSGFRLLLITAASVAVLAVVASLCVVVGLKLRPSTTPFAIPFTVDDVASMGISDYAGVAPQFDVPSSHRSALLAALSPANVDEHPSAWKVFGYLDMTLKDGKPYRVIFSDRGEFQAGGVYCRSADSDRFRVAVRDAYEARRALSQDRSEKNGGVTGLPVTGRHAQLEKSIASLRDRQGKAGFKKLPKAERVLLCVRSLEDEVMNGGFDQYYFNSAGDNALETVAALDTIGAKRTAALVKSMNELFGSKGPAADRFKRQEQLVRVRSSSVDKLSAADSQFIKYEENLDELMAAFVTKHENELRERN